MTMKRMMIFLMKLEDKQLQKNIKYKVSFDFINFTLFFSIPLINAV